MTRFTTRRLRRSSLAALAVLIAAPALAQAGPINVTVTGIRNQAGIVRCGLFASAAGFREPGKEMAEAIGRINGGQATCAFKAVPAGTYAIAVFHAERSEKTMDIGLFGKPKQGVGFSQNPSITFGAPSFNKAAFAVGNAPVAMTVSLTY